MSVAKYWIVDPIAHRRLERKMPSELPWVVDVVIRMVDFLADDEWACDYCNGMIRVVRDDGMPIPVPVVDTDALCGKCLSGESKFPPWALSRCACGGCIVRTERLMKEAMRGN